MHPFRTVSILPFVPFNPIVIKGNTPLFELIFVYKTE